MQLICIWQYFLNAIQINTTILYNKMQYAAYDYKLFVVFA